MDNTTQGRLRVSDADRDAVVTELGGHFQDGRLDQAELEDRAGRALRARVRGDLDVLLADLPRPVPGGPPAAVRRRPPLPVFLVPALIAAVLVTAALTVGGGPHRWAAGALWWPVWWLIPLVALRLLWASRRLGGYRPWR